MPIDGSATGNEFATALAGELPRLVHLATRLVRDPDQAEDCAQETIVGAWRRRDQLRDPASLVVLGECAHEEHPPPPQSLLGLSLIHI